tara:strand:- start:33 stop:200 length:168 start_codon:yes stop_codon:yes gene_type:complete
MEEDDYLISSLIDLILHLEQKTDSGVIPIKLEELDEELLTVTKKYLTKQLTLKTK